MGNKFSVKSSTHSGRHLQIRKHPPSISSIKPCNGRIIYRFHAPVKYQQHTKPSSQQDSQQLEAVIVQEPNIARQVENEHPDVIIPVACCLTPKNKSSSDSQIVISDKSDKHKCKQAKWKLIKDKAMYNELKKIESSDEVISCYVLSVNSETVIFDKSIKVKQVLREDAETHEAQTDSTCDDEILLTTTNSVDELNYEHGTMKEMCLNEEENVTSKSETNITKHTENKCENDAFPYDNIIKKNALVLWKEDEISGRQQSSAGLVSTEKLNRNSESIPNIAHISSEQLLCILTEPAFETENCNNAISETNEKANISEVKYEENKEENASYEFQESKNTGSKCDKNFTFVCYDCIEGHNLFQQSSSTTEKEDVFAGKFCIQKSENLEEDNSSNEDSVNTQSKIEKPNNEVVENCEVESKSLNKGVTDNNEVNNNAIDAGSDFCSLHCLF